MAKGIVDKILGGLGLVEEIEVEEEKILPETREKERDFDNKNKKATVVNLHSAPKQLKVVVVDPVNHEDSQLIADHLKNRKPVVVNFETTDREVAKRIVDFISGTIYALGGTMQKIGVNIFLCAPSNVDIALNQREEVADKAAFNWTK